LKKEEGKAEGGKRSRSQEGKQIKRGGQNRPFLPKRTYERRGRPGGSVDERGEKAAAFANKRSKGGKEGREKNHERKRFYRKSPKIPPPQ